MSNRLTLPLEMILKRVLKTAGYEIKSGTVGKVS